MDITLGIQTYSLKEVVRFMIEKNLKRTTSS